MFWKPRGRRLTKLDQLRDGMSVQAILYVNDKSIRRKVKDGHILIQKDIYITHYYIVSGDNKYSLGATTEGRQPTYQGALVGQISQLYGYYPRTGVDEMARHRIHVNNKYLKGKSMANTLLSLLKLNKNQRQLNKAGVYDENGNLTDDGQELLMNLLAKDYELKMVELTKDMKSDKKKKSDDDSI